MSNRAKNPLYVVKNGHVEEAENFMDLLIKKFNLTPVFEILGNILQMLLENVKTYSAFVVVQEFLDFFISKVELFRKYSIV
jgi:hypothetical protein